MTRRYAERVCLSCGETIREGAYSGRDGNFKKHVAAHYPKGSTESYEGQDAPLEVIEKMARKAQRTKKLPHGWVWIQDPNSEQKKMIPSPPDYGS